MNDKDFITVIRYQVPKANGMLELHKLTIILAVLQDRGQKIALVTDDHMSGASGKIPAAIYVTQEALNDGPIVRLQDGDVVCRNVYVGKLVILEDKVELTHEQLPLLTLKRMNMALDVSFFIFFTTPLIVQIKEYLCL
ncbi:hypothetical protein O9A_00598 [Bartonella koehlerae C-29]|uniref:Dihydroxy-acid/6-phosphogluconate dehydratase C-terminal domain-containing protein n=1 Tax=Bartonella koehlerae C-29 TaxID=1134510 RepID=A0A067WES1_9HYPH|nr:hypothetical protein O9A_00598 [Bartonella koehlerae C-29]